MTIEEFDQIRVIFQEKINMLLTQKRNEYAPGDDRLSNFVLMRDMGCGKSRAQALWNSGLVKHLASIKQMVENPAAYSFEMWGEKTIDVAVYMILLRGCVVDDIKDATSCPIPGRVPDSVPRESEDRRETP